MIVKNSRIDESRLVASELLDCLEKSHADIDSIILKAQRLARLMRDADAKSWLGYEMKGYPKNFTTSELGT